VKAAIQRVGFQLRWFSCIGQASNVRLVEIRVGQVEPGEGFGQRDLRGQTPKSCNRAGERRHVTVSADVHVHVVLLTVVEKWDGSVGALDAVEDNPRHRITAVVADADVVERLAVAVVDLE
jgi:hypothetical protein